MVRQDLDSPRQHSADRLCDHPSCHNEGEYRAPKSRGQLRSFYWFCLDHVREYNAAWNYFAGMSQAEIERFQRENAFGHRPTWRMGVRNGQGNGARRRMVDEFGLFEEGLGPFVHEDDGASERPFKPGERQALALMNLDSPVTLKEIKERYKELVKLHHPDANGGDKESEERLKKIIHAYTHLLSCGYS
jgi:curved DNA-binding protein CbpA